MHSVNIRQISIIGGAMLVAGGAFIWMRSQSANPQVVQPVSVSDAKAETVCRGLAQLLVVALMVPH